MGSERQEGSVTSLQRKGERSLVDGDEFQSLRESRAALALCEVAVCYVAAEEWPPLIPSVQIFVPEICGWVEIQATDKTRNTELSMVLKNKLHIKRQAVFLATFLPDTQASYSRRSLAVIG